MRALRTERGALALGLALLAAGGAHAQVQTNTESWGTMYGFDYIYDGRTNTSYQTRLTATVNGTDFLFDETFFRSFYGPEGQDALARAGAIRGIAINGAPAVLTWGDPVLLESYEELLDSFTEVSYSEVSSTVVTVQLTSGDAPNNFVYIGERGDCYSFGTSGATNFAPFDGSFADCNYFEEVTVEAGTLNTNTHTTNLITTVETSFTNTDILLMEHWQLQGITTLVGTVHPAVQTAAFEAGAGFRSRLMHEAGLSMRGRAAGGKSAALRAWAGGHGSRAETDADAGAVGNRRSGSGVSAGLAWAPAGHWGLGFGIDRTRTDLDALGAPETAGIELDQLALHGGWDNGRWFATATATHGRGDVHARHGSAALGGVSVARYDLRLDGIALEAGHRVRIGAFEVTPQLGADWMRSRSDAFAETGGIALVAPRHSVERSSAWLGLAAAREWQWGSGQSFRIEARARLHEILSGQRRVLPVQLAGLPGEDLRITGARDDGTRAELALDASLGLGHGVSLWLGLEAQRSGGHQHERAMAGLRFAW